MAEIPDEFRDLLEGETYANLATLMPDGAPHVTPVWVDYDGEHVLVNTVRGRRKEKNVGEHSKVGLDILDPENPYRYISIRGEVVELTEDGAVEHIDELARQYMDVEEYPNRDSEEGARVILKIRPDHVVTNA